MGTFVKRRSRGEIEQYDPVQGLKNIAIAEVAEKHFARAKDATRLLEAIEHKLGEQRRFVVWWDGEEKHPGRRPSKDALAVADQQRLKAGALEAFRSR